MTKIYNTSSDNFFLIYLIIIIKNIAKISIFADHCYHFYILSFLISTSAKKEFKLNFYTDLFFNYHPQSTKT